MYYVYILKSIRDGRLYVGRSGDLKQRYSQHTTGKCYTTKRMLPITLVYYEAFIAKDDSIRREKYLKTSKGKSTLRMMLRCSLEK